MKTARKRREMSSQSLVLEVDRLAPAHPDQYLFRWVWEDVCRKLNVLESWFALRVLDLVVEEEFGKHQLDLNVGQETPRACVSSKAPAQLSASDTDERMLVFRTFLLAFTI